jgi:hypothetical protein
MVASPKREPCGGVFEDNGVEYDGAEHLKIALLSSMSITRGAE